MRRNLGLPSPTTSNLLGHFLQFYEGIRPYLKKSLLYLGQGVIEVIPAKVEVLRCGGVCHEDNTFHQCLPTVNRTKTVQVS